MTEDHMKNKELDAYFHALKENAAEPSEALLARVLADAETAQPRTIAPLPAESRPSFWQDFLRAIGGWPALAGLATATVAGVWIGGHPFGRIAGRYKRIFQLG